MEEQKSVLVIDDTNAQLKALNKILSATYDVIIAQNGKEGLAIAHGEKVDMILLDLFMPEMSGFEVLSELKKSEKTREIPVIIISGSETYDDELRGLVMGAVDFIRKPFVSNIVKLRVGMHLKLIEQNAMLQEQVHIIENYSRAKSRFLARMSHEIRSPISAVLGISEIQLQKRGLRPEIEEAFGKILASGNLLLGIVNDILDLSKIEADKLSLIVDRYDVASLINDTVQLNLGYIGDKDIKFSVSVDENLPACLYGDELRIKQVLNNLLSNAFKYTEAGTVSFGVGFENTQSENIQSENTGDEYTNLVMTVSDTGRGMTDEQLNSIFQEYERFHEKEARQIGGTGLGMPIVSSLLTLMEAAFDIKSSVGGGTTVTVGIPQKIAGSELVGSETARNLESFRGSLSKGKTVPFRPEAMPYGRVLVVDDVETNIYVAKGLLGLFRLNVDACSSGFDAIDRVKRGELYDIVFMDQMMPDISGTETTQRLRRLGYERPIVALTANALLGHEEEFLKNGFDAFLPKPIQTVRLTEILNRFIRDKQPEDVVENARKMAEILEEAETDESLTEEDASGYEYLLAPEFRGKILAGFVEENANVVAEINEAVRGGDMETARRLAHTLKGSARLLNETVLAEEAFDVETIFSKGGTPTIAKMNILEKEVSRVLAVAE